MRLRDRKRASLLGFMAGSAVLATAGTAFACTEFLGKVTITGPGNVSATYRGDGTDQTSSTKGYCETPSRVEFSNPAPTLVFTLAVEMKSGCGNNKALPAGPYEVRWVKATDGIVHGAPEDCNSGAVPDSSPWVAIGTMTMADTPSGADGSGTYALPVTMSGPGNICVTPVAPDPASVPMIFMKWTVV